jgi:type IV secretory pathway VirB2 component (pilin)
LPGAGLIQTLQTFITGPLALFLCIAGLIVAGSAYLFGEGHQRSKIGHVVLGATLILWVVRWVTFIQTQS